MPGFDPDQPRDEKGQWTAGDASAALKSAASDVRVGDVNYLASLIGTDAKGEQDKSVRNGVIVDQIKKMNEVADLPTETIIETVNNAIRHQPYETIVLLSADGDMLGVASGEGDHVEMSIKQSDMYKFKDGYATHNHPYDQSFSNGDIYTMTSLKVQEARAASAGNEYIFRPNYEYGRKEFLDKPLEERIMAGITNQYPLVVAYNQSMLDVQKSYTDAVEIGAMDLDDANRNFQHKIMEVFADRTGSYYEKRPLSSVRTDVPRDLYKTSSYPDFEQAEKVRLNRIELRKKPSDRKFNF